MATLVPLYDGSQSGTAANIVNIIILPEIGTRTSSTLINTLAQIQSSARIFEFPSSLSLAHEGVIWASLIKKADHLLAAILEQPQLWAYPLVFICHGLSGIVVKRTVAALDERFHEHNSRQIMHAQAGIVFVSTPHLTYSNPERWKHLISIVRSCPGYAKCQNQNETATIANVCAKFEDTPVNGPILSFYETRETKLADGWRHKRVLLVDRDLAQINARREALIPIDADHHEIFNTGQTDDMAKHLTDFLLQVQIEVQRAAATDVEAGMQDLTIRRDPDDDDADTWASTIHQPANAEPGEPSDDPDTNQATKGTTDPVSSESARAGLPAEVSDYLGLRRSVQLPCFFLSSYIRNEDFYGREDTLTLMDTLLLPSSQPRVRGPGGPRAFVISGMGGVGKTQCALEYADRCRDKFDAVLWAQADTAPKLDESFSQISVALGLETASKAGDRVVSRNLVTEWLCNPVKSHAQDTTADRASWLLIFDNADDPKVLSDFWPSSGTGSIIVTSRDPLARRLFSNSGIGLESLSTEAAATLLRRLSDIGDSPEDVEDSKRVASRLGGLPLAISLAAAAILRQELTFDEFLSFYEAEPSAADIKPISLRPETQYEHTLSTVWGLESFPGPAKCLLQLLSVMDPDGISENIITQQTKNPMPAGYPSTKPDFINARGSLLKASLVKRDKTSSHLSLHRLTQDFLRLSMSPELLKQNFTTALSLCMQYWPKPVVAVSYATSTWPASEAVVPHVLFLRELWKKQPELATDSEALYNLADLSWRVAWYFEERGMPGENIEDLFMSSIEICKAEPSLQLSATHAFALFGVSVISLSENEPPKSLKYAMLNLDVNLAMEQDPANSQNLGIAYNHVGWACLVNDMWEKAVEYFRKSIEMYSRWEEVTLRGFRPEFPWGGLAIALSELGDHKQAAEIHLETIAHREKIWGPADTDSIKFGRCMQCLGDVRLKQGRLDESFDAYRKALANYEVTSGPRYFRTGHVYGKLGEHHALRRQYTEADARFKQALNVFQGRTPYKGEVGRILHLQAKMYASKGDSEQLVQELEAQALALYEEVVKSGRLAVFQPSLEDVDFNRIVPVWAR